MEDSPLFHADVDEYQQVQHVGDVQSNSDTSSDGSLDDGSVVSDDGGGNLEESSDGEWNALCGNNDAVSVGEGDKFSEAIPGPQVGDDLGDGDVCDGEVDVESAASSPRAFRRPRDPTYGVCEEEYSETGYPCESEVVKSRSGINHPESQSVLLHSDAHELLEVCRGHRLPTCDDRGQNPQCMLSLREEADVVPAAVFDVLRKVFPDVFLLRLLLRLDGVKDREGWADIKPVFATSPNDAVAGVYVEDVVDRVVRLCQGNCLYEGFLSGAERREVLEELGYAIGHASGQGCNCVIDSLLQVLLQVNVNKCPSDDVNVSSWRHEACE